MHLEISTHCFSHSTRISSFVAKIVLNFQERYPKAVIQLKASVVNELRYVYDRPAHVSHIHELLTIRDVSIFKTQAVTPLSHLNLSIFGYIKPQFQEALFQTKQQVPNKRHQHKSERLSGLIVTKPLFSQRS